jgi:hypothetical protein
MPKFERNDVSLIQKEIGKNVKLPRLAEVEEVYEHGALDDDSNFEADVTIAGDREDKCPIVSPGSGRIDIPQSGDKVMVLYTEEENQKPYIIDTAWTVADRPPLGKAGMVRREFPIADAEDSSPAGDGNLYFTGYTKYDKPPANTKKDARKPEKAVVQLAKHAEDNNLVPTEQKDIPAKIEFYDAPIDDEAHISIDANSIDKKNFGETLGLDIFLDLKEGELHVRGENDNDNAEYEFVLDVKSQTAKIIGDSNSDNKMGASFNFATDEFKIADGNKFGIKSDGSGNFVWDHKSIDFNEVGGSTGNIDI